MQVCYGCFLLNLQVPGQLEGIGQGKLLFVADHLDINEKHSKIITVIIIYMLHPFEFINQQ